MQSHYAQYNLLDFFPDCILPDCPEREHTHQHILPHQQTILDSDHKYLYCQGGVGSAKSLAFAVKCVLLSLIIPNNIGVISRIHYSHLYRTSWREFVACINRLVKKGIIQEPERGPKKMGGVSSFTFRETGSVVYAMPGKDWSEGLGSSYGFFWVDDALESFAELFIGDNTSGGLISRLRLPEAHFHSSFHNAETSPHGALRGMISTNPPPYGHYLHELFGKEPGEWKLGNDKVLCMQVQTKQNPFVGADYDEGIRAIQKKLGKGEDTIARLLDGVSQSAFKGVPVFPQFDPRVHVGEFKFDPRIPLIVGWDFGFHHPAVVFNHLYKCKERTLHFISLSEISEARECTVHELYNDFYKPHFNNRYKDAITVLHAGDRAGYRESSSSLDRRGDMKILMHQYNLPFVFKYLSLNNSLQFIREKLKTKNLCRCGKPVICIDRKGCPALIEALKGGYRYTKRKDGQVSEKPLEDRMYADIACAWRYAVENYIGQGISWEIQKEHLLKVRDSQFSVKDENRQPRKDWESMTDGEILAMVIA